MAAAGSPIGPRKRRLTWRGILSHWKQRALGVTCVLLSPGWVKTRMGGAAAEITSEESVGDMRTLIGRLTITDTGRFLRRDGSTLPW